MNQQEVLSHHHRALEEYIADINQKGPAFMEQARAPYISVLGAARRYFAFMNYVIDQVDTTAEPQAPLNVYAQIAEKLAGLELCLRHGFVSSASNLLRGLYEAEMTLALLTERDVMERSRLYTEYEKVDRWYNMKAQKELVDEGAIIQQEFERMFSPKQAASITANYNSVKADYHPTQPGTFGWAWKLFATSPKDRNPSLKAIAKHLRRLKQYNMLYSVLSAVAHPSSVGRKALTDEKGMLSPGFHFNQWTKQFATLAVVYANQALTHIRVYLPPPLADELILYSQHFLQRMIAETDGKAVDQV